MSGLPQIVSQAVEGLTFFVARKVAANELPDNERTNIIGANVAERVSLSGKAQSLNDLKYLCRNGCKLQALWLLHVRRRCGRGDWCGFGRVWLQAKVH